MRYEYCVDLINLPMDNLFTYLKNRKQKQIIKFLDTEIDSLESLIDLHSNLESDKMSCNY